MPNAMVIKTIENKSKLRSQRTRNDRIVAPPDQTLTSGVFSATLARSACQFSWCWPLSGTAGIFWSLKVVSVPTTGVLSRNTWERRRAPGTINGRHSSVGLVSVMVYGADDLIRFRDKEVFDGRAYYPAGLWITSISIPFSVRTNDTQSRNCQNEQRSHMTTYLYRPGHPFASKSGWFGCSR